MELAELLPGHRGPPPLHPVDVVPAAFLRAFAGGGPRRRTWCAGSTRCSPRACRDPACPRRSSRGGANGWTRDVPGGGRLPPAARRPRHRLRAAAAARLPSPGPRELAVLDLGEGALGYVDRASGSWARCRRHGGRGRAGPHLGGDRGRLRWLARGRGAGQVDAPGVRVLARQHQLLLVERLEDGSPGAGWHSAGRPSAAYWRTANGGLSCARRDRCRQAAGGDPFNPGSRASGAASMTAHGIKPPS